MIEAGLYSLLSTTSAITALCGTRIYPILEPDEPVYPCIIYKGIASKSDATLTTSGMQKIRMQIDCFGERPLDAVNLRMAVVEALNGYQGVLIDGTILQNVDLVNMFDLYDSVARVSKCSVEFYMYFNFNF